MSEPKEQSNPPEPGTLSEARPHPEPRNRLGLRFDPRLADPARTGECLAALQEAAPQAEALGFDVLWIAERPTSEASLVPSALVLAASVAMGTDRLRIASGLLPLPFYHPLRVAEDVASLDVLSAGRFELGVGLGADPAALAHFGVDAEERIARFEEALDLIAAAWRGPLEPGGHFFPTEAVEIHPRPIQPDGPPVWIGVEAPTAQRRVAERSQGLLVRAGVSVRPYLKALGPGESSRVAFLLGADLEGAMPGEEGIEACDWVLPLDPELEPQSIGMEIERLAGRAASLGFGTVC